MPSLKQKSVKGVAWNLTELIGHQGIRFVLGVMLARLLTPADFGLVGMITVFFAVAQVFVSGGFGQAYIQKKHVSDVDANTVFFTNLAVSFGVYGILWLAAPAIAGFYEQPLLVDLTRVMGLVVIINAFNIIQMAQVTRAVDFKRKTKITLTATMASGVAGVAAAYYGLGVWSLVIQQMANRVFTTVGLWMTTRWMPRLQFSRESFKSLFSFGAWVLAAGIIKTIFDNIYVLTIGKFFPVAELGFYSKAKQFQAMAAHQIAGAVGAVAFPVLSQLQDEKLRLKQGVRKFLTHSLAFTAPILVTLMVVAEPFVRLLLTDKWAPMIPYLQLLCIAGFLYPIHLVNVQVLQAQGRSDLNFRLTVIKNSLRIINIAVMYRFGVAAIIMGEVLLSFFALVINTYYTRHLIGYGLLEQFADIRQILAVTLVSGLAGYAAIHWLTNLYAKFFLGGTVTVVLYVLLQYLLNRVFFLEILKLKENFIK
ncbi:MAG: lipopolysaccharide biosynthesis protein [Desulfobacterium sp.]|nr:lipopolysaccharide biosynthesis protein [Desulfobacterium sp.]